MSRHVDKHGNRYRPLKGGKGSNPCAEDCTCKRHSIGERRNSSAIARKGWTDERRASASANQRATYNAFEGHQIAEVKGYHAAHSNTEKVRGKAKTHKCVTCNDRAGFWSLAHREIATPVSIYRDPVLGYYSTDANDYIPLCGTCHRRYDNV
jgi:hypothetical protein